MSKDKLTALFALRIFFLLSASSMLISNNIFKGKEALINIDNSKKSTKSPTKQCNSEKYCILQNVLENVLFFFTNLSQGDFYIAKGFLYQLKFVILPLLPLKSNKT